MKDNPPVGLIAQLNRIKSDLDAFTNPESKASFLSGLDDLIARLTVLREQLTQPPVEKKVSEVGHSLGQVIDFLRSAKDDHTLASLISGAMNSRPHKSQRAPVQIPPNLTNEQIREYLAKDLSKSELKAVAAQRGISSGKRSDEDVRRDILRALERQEGYQRLAKP